MLVRFPVIEANQLLRESFATISLYFIKKIECNIDNVKFQTDTVFGQNFITITGFLSG